MRTTLDIDDDVLAAVKELSRRQRKSAGTIISELARQALNAGALTEQAPAEAFFGIRPVPKRSGVVITNELIDKIRSEGEY